MPAMGMVQMPGHQIIDVAAVRHGFVAAMGSMLVAGLMPLAFVARRTIVRVRPADPNRVFVVVVIMMMVQMPVMQIIHVIVVLYRGVAASRSVDVDMVAIGVHLVRHKL